MNDRSKRDQRTERNRWQLLEQLEEMLETPMVALAFAWLALIVYDLVRGLPPFLAKLSDVIWMLFAVDFVLKFTVAPRKLVFLRANALVGLSLLVPALRVLRIARVAQIARTAHAARGLRLAGIVGSVNRGMRSLRAMMRRRGLAYVITLTILVTFAGAAGMYAFERNAPGGGFPDYGTALWWTAMILTTMGSEYWPKTAEGRMLCLLIATYAVAVFGYITAFLASFFIDRDADAPDGEVAGARAIAELRAEIRALRQALIAEGRIAARGAGHEGAR
jgi:voltage-gated potassium channel